MNLLETSKKLVFEVLFQLTLMRAETVAETLNAILPAPQESNNHAYNL
jgi:hypothetical protein